MLLIVIMEYNIITILGIEPRKAIADNNGIQATLIAMEIGSQDPQIQSCGLALLACVIIESMLVSLQGVSRTLDDINMATIEFPMETQFFA